MTSKSWEDFFMNEKYSRALCQLCNNRVWKIYTLYCDDCRWEIHHKRKCINKDITKEEWKREQKESRYKVSQM